MTPFVPLTWDAFQPIANHLWQSTLVLAVCAAFAALLRHNRAHVRHWLWLVASLKFAVPFALLVELGRRLAVPAASITIPAFALPPAAGAIAEPFSDGVLALPAASTPSAAGIDVLAMLPSMLAVVWMIGALATAATWYVRWRRLRAIAAVAVPAVDGREVAMLRALEARADRRRPVPIMVTASALEPGVFGVLRPVLLWPGAISARLDEAQIEAVLAHELSHVRRHDNLKAAVHMVVEAVFWFHPLVWWLGAKLVDERERACDEAVLQLGSDPETYAESILKTCEFHIESPLVCVAGVTGADLTRRIEQIMDSRVTRFLTLRRKLLLTCAALLLLFGPVFAGTLQETAPQTKAVGGGSAPSLLRGKELHSYSLLDVLQRAVAHVPSYQVRRLHDAVFGAVRSAAPAAARQSTVAPADAATLTFDVASVKPNKSGDGAIQIGVQLSRFVATNMPVRQMIIFAYGVQRFQVEGGPSWLDSERYDVNAKIPDSQVNAPLPLGEVGPVSYMVRNLLADRFKLVIERTTKEAPVYELQLARADGKLGPALKVSDTDCAAMFAAARAGGAPPPPPQPGKAPPCGLMMGPGNIAGGSSSMTQLARALSNRVGRPVIDKTGLTGNFEFTVDFQPDFGGLRGGGPPTPPPGAPPLPPVDPDAPSVFAALQEQLGLKLEAKRGPVDTLVIKSAEMPNPD